MNQQDKKQVLLDHLDGLKDKYANLKETDPFRYRAFLEVHMQALKDIETNAKELEKLLEELEAEIKSTKTAD